MSTKNVDTTDNKDVLSAEDLIELAQEQSSSNPTGTSGETPKQNGKNDPVVPLPSSTSLNRGQRFVPQGAFFARGRGSAAAAADDSQSEIASTVHRPHPIEAILVREDGTGGEYGNNTDVDEDDDTFDVYTAEPLSVWRKTSVWSPQKWASCGLAALCLLSVIAVSIAVVATQRRRKPPLKDNGGDSNNSSALIYDDVAYTHHTALFGSVLAQETDECAAENPIRPCLRFRIRCGTPQSVLHLHTDGAILNELSILEVPGSREEDEIVYSVPPNTVASIAFDCEQTISSEFEDRYIAIVGMTEEYDNKKTGILPCANMTAFVHLRTQPSTTCPETIPDEERCSNGSLPMHIAMDSEWRGAPHLLLCQQMRQRRENCVGEALSCLPTFGIASTDFEDGCPAQQFQQPLQYVNYSALALQTDFVEQYIRERVDNSTMTTSSKVGG